VPINVRIRAAAAAVFLCTIAYGTVFYVHPDSTQNNIQACLDMCSENDTVLVGPGTYYENILWPDCQGIKLLSEYGRDTTVIDGGGTDRVLCVPGGTDTTTVIRGFTITNGFTDDHVGAGVRCDTNASPLIEDNLITGNHTTGSANAHGAGIGASVNASPVIRNNVISDNHAGGSGLVGGAVFCMEGGAPLITGNRVEYNTASSAGGGIACYADAGAQVRNNDVTGNTGGSGGGIACLNGSMAVVAGNRVTGNEADSAGGGIIAWTNANPVIIHNLVSGNSAPRASGIGCWVSSSPAVESCDVCDNTGEGLGCAYASAPNIRYCNIAGNTSYGVRNLDPAVTVLADSNWWGHATGPFHPDSNPGGMGDTVSDHVDFSNWLQQPVSGQADESRPRVVRPAVLATIVRGVLRLQPSANSSHQTAGLLDIGGRKVMDLEPGLNDIRQIAPGIYFVRREENSTTTKVVVQR
jgi:parallel beta-helix repeat protein